MYFARRDQEINRSLEGVELVEEILSSVVLKTNRIERGFVNLLPGPVKKMKLSEFRVVNTSRLE